MKQEKLIFTLLALVMSLAMLLSIVPLTAFAAENKTVTIDTGEEVTLHDSNGDGYYEISTADELYAFAALVNGGETSVNAQLTADILVNSNVLVDGALTSDTSLLRAWTPMGSDVSSYRGTFDGAGHTISGLYYKNSSANYAGLFGYLGGTVKNIYLLDCYMEGAYNVGGIAGWSWYGKVETSSFQGVVAGKEYVAGIAANANYGYITNCYSVVTLSGKRAVGGVAGHANAITITNCYTYGNKSAYGSTGGSTKVVNCYYLSDTETDNFSGTTAKTAEQFLSGEVCYLLNSAVTDGSQAWYQTCGEGLPTFTGQTVYYGYTCEPSQTEKNYTNIPGTSETKPTHPGFENGVCILCGMKCDHESYENGFCADCDMYQAAELNEDGIYEISNAGQLYWFADKVNKENNTYCSADAILTADIVVNEQVLNDDGTLVSDTSALRVWMPMGFTENTEYGSEETPYSGTFDGAGHTISGLYVIGFEDPNMHGCAFIGQNEGTVKNLGLLDSCITCDDSAGGIVGGNSGTITGCYNAATVIGDNLVGGIAYGNTGIIDRCYNTGMILGEITTGGIAGQNVVTGTVVNCYNTGIVGGDVGYSRIGGIVGSMWTYEENTFPILRNCWNNGVVTGEEDAGSVVGYVEKGTVENCYYDSDTEDDSIEGTTAKRYAMFTSGEVCYLLNSGVTDGSQVWYQTINTDLYPTFQGETVYYGYTCDDRYPDMIYANDSGLSDTKFDHVYDNGFCTNCDDYQPAVLNADNVYEIGNAGQLYWFAALVNADTDAVDGMAQDCEADAILTADIVVNAGEMTADSADVRVWTPISNTTYGGYQGTFDGDVHTISGLYFNRSSASGVGLFAALNEGTVKNVGVINSFFSGNQQVGAIVGYAVDYSTIENCYNSGEVYGGSYVGGVAGEVTDSSVLKNCYNTGNVFGTKFNTGGVVGSQSQASTLENCYNTGNVGGNSSNVGGVAGACNGGSFKDCYNTGSVTGTDYVGGVGGNVQTDMDNCYNTGKVTLTNGSARGGVHGGGVAGVFSSGTMSNCYNTGDVSGYMSIGGMIGGIQDSVMMNCYSTGAVTGDTYIGGLTGLDNNQYFSLYLNCHNTGVVTGVNCVGGLVGGLGPNSSPVTITNSYYLSTSAAGSVDSRDTGVAAERKTQEAFTSGEVAWLLSQGCIADSFAFEASFVSGEIWGQNIGTDAYPVHNGAKVYRGYADCGDNAEMTYSNTELGDTKPDHSPNTEGLCTVCGYQYVASVTIGEDTTYLDDIQLAIDSAESGTADAPATVRILNDVDMTGSTTNLTVDTGVMTIDLNGHTIMAQNGAILQMGALNTPCDAEVTIADRSEAQTGKLLVTGYGMGIRNFGGHLIVESGVIRVEDKEQILATGIRVVGGQVTIRGGSIYAQTNDTATPAKAIELVDGASAVITGGELVSTYAVYAEGNVTVSGDATLTGSQYAIQCQGDLTITGGVITGKTADIWFKTDSGTLTLGVNADTGIGATFPSGITVVGAPLNGILAENVTYWAGNVMYRDVSENGSELVGQGDITVRTICDHTNGDAANDGDHTCDLCGTLNITACADADKDHLCDDCKAKVSDCADENKDYICDICGKDLEEPVADEVVRLAGAHRWATSLMVADEMKANLGVEKFDSIIIASGNDFADALAGSYLSTVKNAPILLAWGKGGKFEYLDTDNIDYIKANLAEGGTVYILGGTNAVPELYENELKGYKVVRLGGANRFETNLLILAEAGVNEGDEILVCTSTNFADSLSASATGKPILLVFNELGKLYGKQPEYLASLKNCTFTVIGGESAVSADLAKAIEAYGKVERLAGANRFETSVLVAEEYFEKPETAVLAYAWNYPDGLCGGSLAFSMDAPLILTMTKYEAKAVEYATEIGIETGIVLGGDTLISDDAVRAIFAMETADEIIVKK